MSDLAARAVRLLRHGDLALYLAVLVVTVVSTVFSLHLWNMTWSIPLSYDGDAILIASHMKTDLETGWYESQSLLGAPFGQVYHDWKSADNLHHMIVSLFRVFTHDWGVAINLYYLLGYLFAGLTATYFLRRVGVSRAIAGALGVLYAIAPYHLIRGEGHLWLSSYYPIPLALVVVYAIASGAPVWGRHATRTGIWGAITGPTAFTLFALALVATGNSYYGFFIVLLIALAGLIRFVSTRNWRVFLGAVVAGVWTALVMLANMLPDLLYSFIHGSNPVAVGRFPVEAELYALKFMQLVLPMPEHRIGPLRTVRAIYDGVYPFPAESPALGAVAAFGFVAAFAFALYTLIARVRPLPGTPTPQERGLGILSALTIFAFLLSTLGGLSSLVSFFTSDLRGWNRMSILIAMLALGITGLVIDAGLRRLAATRRFESAPLGIVAAAVAVVVLGVGVVDQTTPLRVPDYAAVRASYDADAAMVAKIEALVPTGSMVLQLPYRQFPETPPVNGVYDTDQLKPYLHSDTLRWSGGGIKGRPSSEWLGIAEVLPPADLARAVAAAGFAGILVDTKPYNDGAQVVRDFTDTLGEPAFTEQDGRYAFFTLDDIAPSDDPLSAAELDTVGDWVVNPVYARFTPDYSHGYTIIEGLGAYEPALLLDNPRDTEVEVRIDFDLGYRSGPATLRFTAPDGTTTDIEVTPTPESTSIEVVAPPGRSRVSVSVIEGDPPVKGNTESGPILVSGIAPHDVALEALLGVRSAR